MEEKSQRCEPARLSASQVMTSPATRPVKSPVAGLRRVTCYNSQSASRKVSPVNYNQLSAGRNGRGREAYLTCLKNSHVCMTQALTFYFTA